MLSNDPAVLTDGGETEVTDSSEDDDETSGLRWGLWCLRHGAGAGEAHAVAAAPGSGDSGANDFFALVDAAAAEGGDRLAEKEDAALVDAAAAEKGERVAEEEDAALVRAAAAKEGEGVADEGGAWDFFALVQAAAQEGERVVGGERR